MLSSKCLKSRHTLRFLAELEDSDDEGVPHGRGRIRPAPFQGVDQNVALNDGNRQLAEHQFGDAMRGLDRVAVALLLRPLISTGC